MTEQEARGKQCKEVVLLDAEGRERWLIIFCQASNCMKWRWEEPICSGAETDEGYCGLGGKP